MKRVLSGIQPSGQLHIGNYFGMMSPMIQYQEQNELYCFIVDYHALTTINDRKLLEANTLNAAMDFLALGLDPDKSIFWIQSDVPQVTELTWLLSTITGMGLLERATSYKDKIARGISPNVGLFSYPILMAADILCFGADLVPVGKDQKQHLEMTRDIAQRFNKIYGDVFIVPDADINKSLQLIPGIDGQKMSKSSGNDIPIFADEKIIRKKIMSITTDSTPIEEPKDKNSPLFHIYSLFLNKNEKKALELRYDNPGLRYGDIKKELFDKNIEFFQPYCEKRKYLEKHKDYVLKVLKEGSDKASHTAYKYLTKVRTAMGLNYAN
ncbi:MAG: tryptophan--tRNA ligase [Candidatus Marinimicrobia bacterium]|jgi:tryptophanyl-tRNA synthetase|nr:tryptophan--tRNA ligase [Candidatus Neomarinimicrobiota bacterium]